MFGTVGEDNYSGLVVNLVGITQGLASQHLGVTVSVQGAVATSGIEVILSEVPVAVKDIAVDIALLQISVHHCGISRQIHWGDDVAGPTNSFSFDQHNQR